MSEAITAPSDRAAETNCKFHPFLEALRNNAISRLRIAEDERAGTVRGGSIVGNSDVDGRKLYELYLSSFATQELRQEHTCSCCRQFFIDNANLVILTKEGRSESLLFVPNNEIPDTYRTFVDQAYVQLLDAKLVKVRYSQNDLLEIGQPVKGGFEHFSFILPFVRYQSSRFMTANQEAAEVREDVRLLTLSLNRWADNVLKHAYQLFQNDPRLNKTTFGDVVGDLIDVIEFAKSLRDHRLRNNYLHTVVMGTCKGLARVGQSALGEFLNRLQENVPVEEAVRQFLTMIKSENYMRPKAAPLAQTIEKAEDIIEKLGLKDSLRRRSLRRDEITEYFWRKSAAVEEPKEGGVFAEVQAKNAPPKAQVPMIAGGSISMASLITRKLQGAQKVEVYVSGETDRLGSLTTAVVPEAPPILHYDKPDNRWPISGYMYVKPVHPGAWGLERATWQEVQYVIPSHHAVYRMARFDPTRPTFVLVNGRDEGGLASLPLFPETLIQDLYSVRAVIEAYCATKRLENVEDGLTTWTAGVGDSIRITTADSVTTYQIGSLE